ncbi:protein kinase [Nocardiopsis sp. NPDC006139]|uniref:serine/threonine-protein kinase n=1 Tax=Nocardiopsis sp. NPDC006139 TaxID=3154578 RepID=UPI0033A67AA7
MIDPLLPDDPRTVGRYRLEGVLGGGGMGRVYLGRSPGGRTVAVKVVRPELAGDEGFRRRFAREVEAARRVGGFYTAQVVDADPAADPPWLVTAYVPGPSLSEAVHGGGPLPAAEVLSLAAGLAEGLAAVHEQGIVHRDLKPGNVIMGGDGPRLIDFGIARALDSGDGMTSTGIMGTPAFMAPEQIRGEVPGPATDVFALGCVLVFAATGRSPFRGGEIAALVYRIVHGEPDLSGVPDELVGLVADCLAKDPAARPSIASVLERAASASPEAPTPTPARDAEAARVPEQREPEAAVTGGTRAPDTVGTADHGAVQAPEALGADHTPPVGGVAEPAPAEPEPAPAALLPPDWRRTYDSTRWEHLVTCAEVTLLLWLLVLVPAGLLSLLSLFFVSPDTLLGFYTNRWVVLSVAGSAVAFTLLSWWASGREALTLDPHGMTVVHWSGSSMGSAHAIPWNAVERVGLKRNGELEFLPAPGARMPEGLPGKEREDGSVSIPLFGLMTHTGTVAARRLAEAREGLRAAAGEKYTDLAG